MTDQTPGKTSDLDDNVAEKRRAQEMRKAKKFSTSVLLPSNLKAMKNGELVQRIRFWLDTVDTKVLIRDSLRHALLRIENHIDRKGHPTDPAAIWRGYQPVIFQVDVLSAFRVSGDREQMAEHKKTITLPESMRGELIDVAVDLGITLGAAVRIAASHTYLEQNDDGTWSQTFELPIDTAKLGPDAGPVAKHAEYRDEIRDQRVERVREWLDAKITAKK